MKTYQYTGTQIGPAYFIKESEYLVLSPELQAEYELDISEPIVVEKFDGDEEIDEDDLFDDDNEFGESDLEEMD